MPAEVAQLLEIHAALGRFWKALPAALGRPDGWPDERWRAELELAIGEIAANIVRHAHPPSARAGSLRLRLRGFTTGVEAQFSDSGVAFKGDLARGAESRRAHAAPTDLGATAMEDLPESGYGLGLVVQAVDRLEYARTLDGQNRWTLYKRLPG